MYRSSGVYPLHFSILFVFAKKMNNNNNIIVSSNICNNKTSIKTIGCVEPLINNVSHVDNITVTTTRRPTRPTTLPILPRKKISLDHRGVLGHEDDKVVDVPSRRVSVPSRPREESFSFSQHCNKVLEKLGGLSPIFAQPQVEVMVCFYVYEVILVFSYSL